MGKHTTKVLASPYILNPGGSRTTSSKTISNKNNYSIQEFKKTFTTMLLKLRLQKPQGTIILNLYLFN